MESSTLDGGPSYTVFLIDGKLRGLPVFECKGLFISAIQRNRLLSVGILVRQVIWGRYRRLNDGIGARCYPQRNGTILTGGHIIAIVVVNAHDPKYSAGNGRVIRRIHLGNGDLRLLEVVKDQLAMIAGAKPDGLSGLGGDHIGVRDRGLCHGIAVHRQIAQRGGAIGPSYNPLVQPMLDAMDLKMGVRDGLSGFRIPLENGKGGKFLVHCGYSHSTSAIYGGLIHMGNHRLCQDGIRRRDRDLHEGIHALGNVGDGDHAVFVRLLTGNDLPVLDHVEYGTSQRIVLLIQLQQLQLDLGIIFKDKIHIALAVPGELLSHFFRVRTGGVTRGRSYLRGHIAANGHGVPGHALQITTRTSRVSADKWIVYTLDFDDCSGQALGGVIRINFADRALTGDNRGVGKGHSDGCTVGIGKDHILGPCIVNLVIFRRIQFCDGIGRSLQIGERDSSVTPGHDFFLKRAVGIPYQESGSRQSQIGIGCIHLFDGKLILLPRDRQSAYINGLHIVGRMVRGARPCVMILIDIAVAPDPLLTQI